MAADPRLFEMLAQALSQPSHAYKAAVEGLGIPGQAMEGYTQGADFMEKNRERKMKQMTLSELLGGSIEGLPPQLQNTPIGQIPDISKLAPFIKQNRNNFFVVPGVTTPTGGLVTGNKSTGKLTDSGLEVKTTNHAIPGFPDIEWDTATPSNKALGQAVYEGRVRPQDLGTRDRGMAVKLANEYARVNNKDPLKSYQAEVAGKTANSFASGKLGQNALSINTALGHANDALDAYENVKNLDVRFLNQPLNAIRAQTNDPGVIKLQTTLNALSGELATVFKGTGGTDQEIAHWQNVLSQNLTPDQAKGAITQVDSLLRSRLGALEYQRTSGMSGRGEMPILSPKAAETQQRISGQQTGKIRVGKGNDQMLIDPSDLPAAQAEGYQPL